MTYDIIMTRLSFFSSFFLFFFFFFFSFFFLTTLCGLCDVPAVVNEEETSGGSDCLVQNK